MQQLRIKNIEHVKNTDHYVYDITTESGTFMCNDIYAKNCSGHSIEYIKLNGIKNIPNILSTSKPAGKATTLARHVCSMTQYYTSLFAGAIGWEGVNIFFAPLLRNMNDTEIYELAQTLIFDLSQLAGAKGGQTSFTDFNVYVTVPEHYRETYAVFEKGKFACGKWWNSNHDLIDEDSIKFFNTRAECDEFVKENKTYFILKYKHFEKEAQRFLIQILKVSEKGDATGLPFAFPKINMHINEDCFTYEKDGKRIKRTDNDPIIKILKESASVAEASKGVPYFIFDRNAMSIAQCCFTADTEINVKYRAEDGYTIDGVCTFRELASAIGTTHKPEEDVKVYVYDRGEYRIGKFAQFDSKGHKIFKITTTDNTILKCTENHMHLLYAGKIVSTNNLLIGDLLCKDYNNTLVFAKISAIEEIEYNDKYVYCFEMCDFNNPFFTLANGIVTHNCRLQVQFSEEDKKLVATPEELRFVGVQNVSINLPNCALQVKHDMEKFFKELEHRMRLAVKAHIQKTKYLEHLVDLSNSPLKFYKKGMDGKPYVNFKNGSYLIGLVGLNECVYNLIGQEMHESKDAYVRSLEIVSWMSKKAKELSKEFNMNVKLEESPAESTASRFAILDKRKYNNAFVQENEEGIYYTNSVHFNYKCDMDYVDRLIKQSRMHKFIEAGAMIHLWCGDHLPSANAVYDLLYKTWYETDCVQWVLSPEYTICYDCQKTYTGFFDKCPKCESDNVEGVTRIVGYYIKTSKATRGKKAEILDRNHKAYILK
jgi:anaerobic ribonucleoside-triphosphate reductase